MQVVRAKALRVVDEHFGVHLLSEAQDVRQREDVPLHDDHVQSKIDVFDPYGP